MAIKYWIIERVIQIPLPTNLFSIAVPLDGGCWLTIDVDIELDITSCLRCGWLKVGAINPWLYYRKNNQISEKFT